MDRKAFNAGMTDLSGAFDVGADRHMTDAQAIARVNAYYRVLKDFSPDVWAEVVDWMLGHREAAALPDGRRAPPGFPTAAECVKACQRIAETYQAKLPPPEIIPAPPEVASWWIERIKRIARAGRGPLSSDLGGAVDPTEWGTQTARSLARRIPQGQERKHP